ncbi:Glycosyltransferase [Mucinivorans hirudinis]|uniref:Glycosyltransferase n=1 Tax=Mucinivorans hirudinis TaxID=1433126 RepID=A0A060R636_9BACT|nr:Glycosyltransferase [Mucinivorans hirudinis]
MYMVISEKIIIHDNGVLFTNDNFENGFSNPKHKLIHSLHFFAGKIDNLSYFDNIICVTKFAFDNIGEKVKRLIYNGVREVVSTENRDRVRARYGFEEDECLVLYVGRIEQSKGITFLAKLFSEMGLENARLVIVGSGAYDLVFEKIEANHSKITFLGNIDNQEVHNLMAACDIGVIPSLNEQCSYVALEMMSHGMAIIASEVRGMGELFMGRDIALTVPVDYTDDIPTLDTDVLKQHIITFAGDVGLRKRLGANARREWAEHYTAERMARETFEVYKELAARL